MRSVVQEEKTKRARRVNTKSNRKKKLKVKIRNGKYKTKIQIKVKQSNNKLMERNRKKNIQLLENIHDSIWGCFCFVLKHDTALTFWGQQALISLFTPNLHRQLLTDRKKRGGQTTL